jgi:RNA polymerase sigma factor (sigma-70 family)
MSSGSTWRARNLYGRSRNVKDVGSERQSELIVAARAGDTTAFAELVESYRPRLDLLARRMVEDSEDAQDVVQEALLHAYLGLTQLREPERFGGWLGAIVLNVARMTLRRRGAYQRALARVFAEPRGAEADVDTAARVREAIALLPRHERDVIVLHYVDGLSCEEVGALLGRSTGAVRVRLHRARARLREELAPFAVEEQPSEREERVMVEMKVDDVLVRVSGEDDVVEEQRIVLLREADGDRVLPIWIGAAEGNALAYRLREEPSLRPMTSDLLAQVVRVVGARVDGVAVTRLHERTFYAAISLAVDGRTEELDARPSDALNLAVRTSAPIAVAEDVLDEGAVTADAFNEELAKKEREFGGDPARPGEWRSLSAELLRILHRPPR